MRVHKVVNYTATPCRKGLSGVIVGRPSTSLVTLASISNASAMALVVKMSRGKPQAMSRPLHMSAT
jgi:hypothetical protein